MSQEISWDSASTSKSKNVKENKFWNLKNTSFRTNPFATELCTFWTTVGHRALHFRSAVWEIIALQKLKSKNYVKPVSINLKTKSGTVFVKQNVCSTYFSTFLIFNFCDSISSNFAVELCTECFDWKPLQHHKAPLQRDRSESVEESLTDSKGKSNVCECKVRKLSEITV